MGVGFRSLVGEIRVISLMKAGMFCAGMFACTLPRKWVPVRVKQVLAGLYIVLFIVALARGNAGAGVGITTLLIGGMTTVFIGAELMFTDKPTQRRVGTALIWIGFMALLLSPGVLMLLQKADAP